MLSAAGVGDSIHRVSFPVRLMLRSGNIAVAYRDLAAMERMLSESGLDWLAVRPVTLKDGPLMFLGGPVERYRTWSRVCRADVAAYMVTSLEQTVPYSNHRVMIGRRVAWGPPDEESNQAAAVGGAIAGASIP